MKIRHYTSEIKKRAVPILIEAKGDWSAIKAIAPKIDCMPETL